MDIKSKLSNLESLSVEQQATMPKLTNPFERITKFLIYFFWIFGLFLLVNYWCIDWFGFGIQRGYGFSLFGIPDFFYENIGPYLSFLLFTSLTIITGFISINPNKNDYKRYNEIIESAQKKVAQINKEKIRQKKAKQKELFDNWLQNRIEENGSPDSKICINDDFYDPQKYIIPFSSTKTIYILGCNYCFNEIIKCRVNDKQSIIKGKVTATTKSDNGSMIKRAVVGDVIAGGAGAVIGGATGTKTTTYTQEDDIVNHNYTIEINTTRLDSPLVEIYLGKNERKTLKIEALLNAVIANK